MPDDYYSDCLSIKLPAKGQLKSNSKLDFYF